MTTVPSDLREVLAADPEAQAKWNDLTQLGQRDFIAWIDEAKKPETRKRRVDSVPSRLASGKRRPCCFAVVPLDVLSALNADPDAKAQWKGLSADEKRDFTDWVGAAADKAGRVARVKQATAWIAAGRKGPRAAQ